MGTEVHYHSMRNANEDSNSSNWHLFNTLTNGQYYDSFTPRTATNAYFGHDKDELKEKMLQHEAIFKNQVFELHRLYRRQRDIMEEVKRKEFNKHQIPIDTSSSSSLMPSQKPYEDAAKWQNLCIPFGNTPSRPSIFGAEMSNSPLSCSKGYGSNDCEVVKCRPSKVTKRLFDLELPAHEYIDLEDGEQVVDNEISEITSYPAKVNRFEPKVGVKTFLDDGRKKDDYMNTASGQRFMRSNGLADLNEPVYGQDVNFLGPSSKAYRFNNLPFDGRSNGRDGFYSELSSKVQDHTRFNQTPSLFNTSSAYPFGNLTHKLTTVQTHGSILASPNNYEGFRDKWHRNGNGFYNGSSSGSKELPARLHLVGFDYRNRNSYDDGSRKNFKGSNFIDLTGVPKDVDLNTVKHLSNGDDDSRKRDKTALPWLRSKPVVCVSTSASIEHRGIDINVACDEDIDEQNDVKTDAEIKIFKNNFDLNSCVTEDDDLLVMESVKSSKKIAMEIDLEAPAVSETVEEDEHKETTLEQNRPESTDLENIAAEAIVAISAQQNHTDPVSDNDSNGNRDDPLLWFVEVIDSCEKNSVSATREMDEYEMLNLQLPETKEQDYMPPTPLVPDFQEPDESGSTLTSGRPRRGQGRRGRPRKDFQREILLGITSLSRPEITEDLHIFGGLMRATGHSWNVGSTRKNGKRGRRKIKTAETPVAAAASTAPPPLTPPPSSKQVQVQVVGLDERSLTGWGKTTRRPRRQRCAAGNSVAVQIT